MTTSRPTTAATKFNVARRPFNEVVKDQLILALATENNGTINAVVKEFRAIQSKLSELIMERARK